MNELQHLWSWYIGLFSNADNKIRIAAWAATIATLTFIINFLLKPLILAAKNRFSNLYVKAGISHQFITSPFGAATGMPILTCTITNRSNHTIYVNSIVIKLSEAVNGDKSFGVGRPAGTFPFALAAGEQKKFEYATASLYNQLLKPISQSAKVKFVVCTTLNKKYYSNKFSKEHIVGHIKVAQDAN